MSEKPSEESKKPPEHDLQVTVTYVGNKPFHSKFAATAKVGDVKLAAMTSFDLEAGASAKYVLFLRGAPVADSNVLGALGEKKIEFELRLREEVPKG